MKYIRKIEAILDHTTIDQGLNFLKTHEDFHNLKETYDRLRNTLKQSRDFTDEEASSIINYAIHKEIEG